MSGQVVSEGIQTYEVGIVWYRFWYRSEPIIVSHRGKRREIYSSKNEMECPASMANHMQKNLGHTLSRVSTLSTGKDRFQDVYRHKARYRFWDWYRFFKENANCSFLKKRERRPLALCSCLHRGPAQTALVPSTSRLPESPVIAAKERHAPAKSLVFVFGAGCVCWVRERQNDETRAEDEESWNPLAVMHIH